MASGDVLGMRMALRAAHLVPRRALHYRRTTRKRAATTASAAIPLGHGRSHLTETTTIGGEVHDRRASGYATVIL